MSFMLVEQERQFVADVMFQVFHFPPREVPVKRCKSWSQHHPENLPSENKGWSNQVFQGNAIRRSPHNQAHRIGNVRGKALGVIPHLVCKYCNSCAKMLPPCPDGLLLR